MIVLYQHINACGVRQTKQITAIPSHHHILNIFGTVNSYLLSVLYYDNMASQKKTNTTGTNSNDNGEGPPPTSITNADIFEKLTGTREGAPPDMWTTAEKRRLDEEQEQQDFPQAEDGSRSGSQQQQQQQDDKEKGEENEEETANDEPSDILDRHNKAMATILSRFLNMVNAATDPPPQGAVIEHASLNRLAMRTETAALVSISITHVTTSPTLYRPCSVVFTPTLSFHIQTQKLTDAFPPSPFHR